MGKKRKGRRGNGSSDRPDARVDGQHDAGTDARRTRVPAATAAPPEPTPAPLTASETEAEVQAHPERRTDPEAETAPPALVLASAESASVEHSPAPSAASTDPVLRSFLGGQAPRRSSRPPPPDLDTIEKAARALLEMAVPPPSFPPPPAAPDFPAVAPAVAEVAEEAADTAAAATREDEQEQEQQDEEAGDEEPRDEDEDEDHDEFFARGEAETDEAATDGDSASDSADSLTPTESDAPPPSRGQWHEGTDGESRPSFHVLLARRAIMRQRVGLLVATLVLLLGGIGLDRLWHGKGPTKTAEAAAEDETPRAVAQAVPAVPNPAPTASADPADEEDPAGDQAAGEHPDDKAAVEAANALSHGDAGGAAGTRAQQLRREARALLESGKTREGVAKARAAIEADSSEAEPYILLAAGLQDLGQWAEAKTVFEQCVHRSTKAPSYDCLYFAHAKR